MELCGDMVGLIICVHRCVENHEFVLVNVKAKFWQYQMTGMLNPMIDEVI